MCCLELETAFVRWCCVAQQSTKQRIGLLRCVWLPLTMAVEQEMRCARAQVLMCAFCSQIILLFVCDQTVYGGQDWPKRDWKVIFHNRTRDLQQETEQQKTDPDDIPATVRAGDLEIFGDGQVVPYVGWASVYCVLSETSLAVYNDRDVLHVRVSFSSPPSFCWQISSLYIDVFH